MRASIAVVLALGLFGCFNPSFNNPMCGPQGECPADHTCVQGICRAQPDEIDAAETGDDAAIDGAIDAPDDAPGDGAEDDAPIDAPDPFCQMAICQGLIFGCGNCIDDDADGLVDAQDPDCLGACDDTEDRLTIGFVGENGPACPLDCYYDRDSGQGNDSCRWDLRCYDTQSATQCPYNPAMIGSAQCPNNQSGQCQSTCAELRPNGCDSFGCCLVPDLPDGVYLGSHDLAGNPTCNLQLLSDPTSCWPCMPQPDTLNPCDACEECFARPLPGSCGGVQTCDVGNALCGQPGQPSCPSGEYCVTGCCKPTLQ